MSTAGSIDMRPTHAVVQPSAVGGPKLNQLTAIVPAYNEAEGIRATLEELRSACPELDILVIDDGSTDGTATIAASVPGVRVVSHRHNQGYGAGLKTGARHTTRPFIIWYDADGQHQPQDLVSVAEPVLLGVADASIGVRGADSSVQRERIAGKMILGWVARVISGEKIPDLNSGLRCFRRDVFLRYLHLMPDGFSASTTSTLLMLKRGYRVEFRPIRARPRVGKSTVKVVRDGMRTIQLIVRIIVLFEAFRVFTTLGIALLVPALVYGFAIAAIRGEGFPTLAGTAVLTGVLTFFMGILADQITALRKERFESASDVTPPVDSQG